MGTGYLCNGNIYVNRETREVTIKYLTDIYTSVKRTYQFYRFYDEYTFKLDDGGTNFILYNYKLHTFRSSEVYDTDEVVIGTKYADRVFFNGNYKITYSDGDIYNSHLTTEQLKSLMSTTTSAMMPTTIESESINTYKRVMNYIEDYNYMLAFVTDIHSGGSTRYNHLGYLNQMNELWNFTVLCNGGDIGLDVGESEEDAYKLMVNTKKLMHADSPWLYCKGNHERLIQQSVLGNIFMKPEQRKYPQITFGDSTCLYGYHDDLKNKVRTVYLNLSDNDDGIHYKISDNQIIWVGDMLENIEDGYKIIFTTHLCPNKIGEWVTYPGDYNTASNLISVIESFVNRTSKTYAGKTWNFTNKKAKVVCILSGDSHFNNQTKTNGINYIVRQGYGGCSVDNMSPNATRDNFSMETMCLFDVLVIKDESTAKIFRIGAGGETRDYEFNF